MGEYLDINVARGPLDSSYPNKIILQGIYIVAGPMKDFPYHMLSDIKSQTWTDVKTQKPHRTMNGLYIGLNLCHLPLNKLSLE